MIAIGSDHGGFPLKEAIKQHLMQKGFDCKDFGTNSADSCDYPDFAKSVCEAVQNGECGQGILICSTGIGISIAANKMHGIRAALCGDCYSAKYSRLHNDANVLCLGAKVTGAGLAEEVADIFLSTPFQGEDGRHQRRIDKLMALEDGTR